MHLTQLAITWTPRYQSDNVHLPISFALVPCSSQTPCSFTKSSQFTPSLFQYSPLPLPNPTPQLPTHLLSPHQNLTKLSPPILSPLFNSVAISTLNGLSTSGYASNWWMASNVDVSVYAGDHDVFKRSRQISPVLKSTFGWQIGVVKVILGGTRG